MRFHPWVFSGAIAQIVGEPAEGDIVGVFSQGGDFLAYGHYQIGSIAVRVLSFAGEDVLSPDFWKNMIARALRVRVAVGLACPGFPVEPVSPVAEPVSPVAEPVSPVAEPVSPVAEPVSPVAEPVEATGLVREHALTNCYRLIHGEGDGLPGLIIDYYDGVCVMQAHSVGMFRAKGAICEALKSVYGPSLKAVYDKSSGTAPFKAGLDLVDGYLYRSESFSDDEQIVLENGHKFFVNWTEGQKTGFFLDQKYNRRAVARLAAGHTVLDCFTHTGSFALNAAAGGAARVTAADISAEAIAMAQRNAQRNGLTNMDFLCEDTFELLPRLEREGPPYDFIILDPPAFTKARRTVENAMRGYKEINYRAMKLLPRGGYLATASCSHFATEELFIKMLRAAAKDAHRQLRQIEVKQQAPDHPILWGVPETNYLKFFLFQVI